MPALSYGGPSLNHTGLIQIFKFTAITSNHSQDSAVAQPTGWRRTGGIEMITTWATTTILCNTYVYCLSPQKYM